MVRMGLSGLLAVVAVIGLVQRGHAFTADLAEKQCGLVANCALSEGVVLGVEYLHKKLPGDDDEATLAGRVAVEF
jgi:hypothetical protein